MRSRILAVIFVVVWRVAVSGASELPYVLKDRTSDVIGREYTVEPNEAYATACDYGLNPAMGEVYIALHLDRFDGLYWQVGYTDWSKREGINSYHIDAHTGAVVNVSITFRSHSNKRTVFEIDPAEARVDTVPPPPPVVRIRGTVRGFYPAGPCVIGAQVMNARRGRVEFYVLGLRDDRTATEDMGLELVSLGGPHPLPSDWSPQSPAYPFIKFHKDSLMLFVGWDDGNDEYQEPVQHQFEVYAIDSAGNRSLIPDTLVIDLPERVEYYDERR